MLVLFCICYETGSCIALNWDAKNVVETASNLFEINLTRFWNDNSVRSVTKSCALLSIIIWKYRKANWLAWKKIDQRRSFKENFRKIVLAKFYLPRQCFQYTFFRRILNFKINPRLSWAMFETIEVIRGKSKYWCKSLAFFLVLKYLRRLLIILESEFLRWIFKFCPNSFGTFQSFGICRNWYYAVEKRCYQKTRSADVNACFVMLNE